MDGALLSDATINAAAAAYTQNATSETGAALSKAILDKSVALFGPSPLQLAMIDISANKLDDAKTHVSEAIQKNSTEISRLTAKVSQLEQQLAKQSESKSEQKPAAPSDSTLTVKIGESSVTVDYSGDNSVLKSVDGVNEKIVQDLPGDGKTLETYTSAFNALAALIVANRLLTRKPTGPSPDNPSYKKYMTNNRENMQAQSSELIGVKEFWKKSFVESQFPSNLSKTAKYIIENIKSTAAADMKNIPSKENVNVKDTGKEVSLWSDQLTATDDISSADDTEFAADSVDAPALARLSPVAASALVDADVAEQLASASAANVDLNLQGVLASTPPASVASSTTTDTAFVNDFFK